MNDLVTLSNRIIALEPMLSTVDETLRPDMTRLLAQAFDQATEELADYGDLVASVQTATEAIRKGVNGDGSGAYPMRLVPSVKAETLQAIIFAGSRPHNCPSCACAATGGIVIDQDRTVKATKAADALIKAAGLPIPVLVLVADKLPASLTATVKVKGTRIASGHAGASPNATGESALAELATTPYGTARLGERVFKALIVNVPDQGHKIRVELSHGIGEYGSLKAAIQACRADFPDKGLNGKGEAISLNGNKYWTWTATPSEQTVA